MCSSWEEEWTFLESTEEGWPESGHRLLKLKGLDEQVRQGLLSLPSPSLLTNTTPLLTEHVPFVPFHMLQWKYLIWWHTSQLIPQGKNYNSGLWTVVSTRASAVIRSQGHLDPESHFTEVVPFQIDGVLDLLPTLAKPWVTLHITKQSGHFTVEGPSNLISAPQINLTRRDSACRDILLLWSHHFYLQPRLHLWFTSRISLLHLNTRSPR